MTTHYRGDPHAVDELLSAYLDDDLSPAERETVRASLESDPDLRERLHELSATVALLRDLPQPTLRRSFTLTTEQAEAIRPTRGIAVRQFVDSDTPPVVLPFAPVALPAAAPPPASVFAAPAAAAPASPEQLPANVTPLRPRPPVARFVPLFSALSAVAAVLLIAVLAIDFNGTGNRAAAPAVAQSRPDQAQPFAPTSPSPSVGVSTAAPAAAAGGAVQATAANGATSASARSAPAIAPAAPQATAAAQPQLTVAPQPTAAPLPPPARPATPDADDGGPGLLVRVAEIALVLLLLGGVIGLVFSLRARRQTTATG